MDLTVITEESSIIIFCGTSQKENNGFSLPEAGPITKDDNSHIEQKNWTHIRQWLGYHRFDNPESFLCLTGSILPNGDCFITSFAHL